LSPCIGLGVAHRWLPFLSVSFARYTELDESWCTCESVTRTNEWLVGYRYTEVTEPWYTEVTESWYTEVTESCCTCD